MSLRVVNLTSPPPGMWKYLVPETSTWIPNRKSHARDVYIVYPDLVRAVLAHYKANGIGVPPNLEEIIQDACCRTVGGNYCEDEKGRRNTAAPGFHFDLATVVQGTLTLADWVIHGRPIEPDAVIIARSGTCATCEFNQSPVGCNGCSGDSLKNAIEKIVGKRRLTSDTQLKSCMICGCALIAKTRIPTDILVRHMSEEQMKRLPDFCWLKS